MANQQVPILQKQERLDVVTNPVPYTQAFDQMALTPTALGEFGARLAITASTTLAQQRGYEAGLNPKGSLLPPLTLTDKAYADAYISQAQNTLGLQATKLMQEGQAELAKAWQLTPDMLAQYTKNMSEGLNEIINNAPMQAQPGLAAQFNNSLMQSTGSLNSKMIGQQKQKALQDAALFNNSQLSAMYEAARGGNVQSAEKMHNDMLARTERMKNSGMITPLQAESTNKSARMSLYTGIYTGEALKAFENKTVDQFLADLLDKKPQGMPSVEWEGIARNVMNEVSMQESFKQRNETSLYSEANRLLNEGLLTPDFIAQLESETTSKPRFNNFMAQVAVQQRKNFKSNEAVATLMPQWTNPYAMAVASNKTKNMTLVQAAQDIQQRAADSGRTLDDFEAQAEAMATAGSPVQSFTEQMNAGFLSGNPQLMMRNLNAYRALRNANPKALIGMDKKAEAMMTNFESQMEDGNAPDVAALKSSEVVLQKTPEQMEINTKLIAQWEKTVNTPSRLNSWAAQFADLSDGAKINNLPYFAIHLKNIFKSNMEYLNGDVQGATKMTRDGIDRAWGVTQINGKSEYVFQPIEKTIGLDEGANPLIKHDLYEQIQRQIEPMKIAFEEGQKKKDNRLSFYYRLTPRPSYEEFSKAQRVIADKSKSFKTPSGYSGTPLVPTSTLKASDKELDDAVHITRQFQNDPIKIEKVYADKRVESFEIAIQANPGLQQDAQGVIGSYNVSIRSDNGPSAPMSGWFGGPLSEPVYKANQSLIRSRYFELVGLNPSGMSAFEMNERRIAKKKFMEQEGLDTSINRYGRGFH